MTVDSVLLNFREALRALVPAVERVGISWCRPDAYDEWDAMATTLFDKLVISVIRWSLPSNSQESFRMPPYDLLLASYSSLSTLEVAHSSLQAGRWLFHAFGTMSEPFDVVELRNVSRAGLPIGGDLVACPVNGARFHLNLVLSPETSRILKEVEVVAG